MYNPLYIKTDYSLLSSLIKIDNLINYLKKYNITSCAIVDDNLFYVMEAYNKFKTNNIKLLVGLEIKINDKPILLYAKNEQGYKNLIKIELIKNEQEINYEDLKKYNNDLVSIVFDQDTYNILKDIYIDLFFGVANKKEEIKAQEITNNTAYINKTLNLEQYEYKYLPYIFMIKDQKTISDGLEFKYQNNHLYTNEEVGNIISTTSINNTLKISDMCNFELT